MEASPSTFLPCPEKDCLFTYDFAKPLILKNHRAGVHVSSAKVTYRNSNKEISIERIGGFFYCIKYPHETPYPGVIQVRFVDS